MPKSSKALDRCPTCKRLEKDCGVVSECCGNAHASCLDCDGRLRPEFRTGSHLNGAAKPGPASEANPDDPFDPKGKCSDKKCGHGIATHGHPTREADGKVRARCWVVMNDGKLAAIPPWVKALPARMKRCACLGIEFDVDVPAPSPAVEENEIEESEEEIGDDSEIDLPGEEDLN